MYSASIWAKTSLSVSLPSSSLARAPRAIAASSLSSIICPSLRHAQAEARPQGRSRPSIARENVRTRPLGRAMDARERAYDPRIHREKVFANKMDRRVKPGGDDYLPALLLGDGRHLGPTAPAPVPPHGRRRQSS